MNPLEVIGALALALVIAFGALWSGGLIEIEFGEDDDRP